MFYKLRTDQSGAVVCAELILVATVLVVGLVVGIKSVRDAVVTEMADVGQAIADFDQSYSFTGVVGHGGGSGGAYFGDSVDLCDTSATVAPDLEPHPGSRCVDVISFPYGAQTDEGMP